MATSEVFLREKIDGLGSEGDKVKVKAGFARNFLLPRNLAFPVSRANQKQIQVLLQRRQEREAKELEGARELAGRLEKTSIAIPMKTGKGGKMFGAVTAAEVLKRLNDEGIPVTKKQVHLDKPAKTLGKHVAMIKLHHDVTVELSYEIVSENPIDEEESSQKEKK